MSYANKSNQQNIKKIRMNKIQIQEVFVDGDIVHMKKSLMGWGVVHPIRKNINIPLYDKDKRRINWDNISWKNLLIGGSWIRFFIMIFIIIIVLGCTYEYTQVHMLADRCLNPNLYLDEIINWSV